MNNNIIDRDVEELMEKMELLIGDYKKQLNNRDRLLNLYEKNTYILEKEIKSLKVYLNILGIVLLFFVLFNGIQLIQLL